MWAGAAEAHDADAADSFGHGLTTVSDVIEKLVNCVTVTRLAASIAKARTVNGTVPQPGAAPLAAPKAASRSESTSADAIFDFKSATLEEMYRSDATIRAFFDTLDIVSRSGAQKHAQAVKVKKSVLDEWNRNPMLPFGVIARLEELNVIIEVKG